MNAGKEDTQQVLGPDTSPDPHSSLGDDDSQHTGDDSQRLGPDAPQHLSPERAEHLKPPHYSQVVFGHSYSEFDRDQLFTYYLALKAGLIEANTPIIFTFKLPTEAIADPKILVIEGFTSNKNPSATEKTGNFTNGTNDEPAAAAFYTYHQNATRAFSKELDPSETFKDLKSWLTAAETGNWDRLKLKSVPKDKLDCITDIFYGLKLQHPNIEDAPALLKACVHLLEDVTSAMSQAELLEKYSTYKDAIRNKKQKDFATLHEHMGVPGKLRTSTTRTGLQLTYFDVSGLSVDSGAISVAANKTNADLVILVDDVADDQHQLIGKKILIKIPHASKHPFTSNLDLRQLLAERLDISEMLFGKGYVITQASGYDGHPGIIGSPTHEGSALDPEKVWLALLEFFASERLTKEQFTNQLATLMDRIGVNNYFPGEIVSPGDEYSIAQWQGACIIRDGVDTYRKITLTEADIKYYLDALDGTPDENRLLLLEKTEMSEPLKIVEKRLQEALEMLPLYVKKEDAYQVLLLLNELNTVSITHLPHDLKLSILQLLSTSTQALDIIWNPDNLAFKIQLALPDWIRNDLRTYKLERYNYLSLAKKIDADFIESVLEEALRQPEGKETHVQPIADSLLRILTSEIYKNAHLQPTSDRILTHLIKLSTHPALSTEFRTGLASEIVASYSEMTTHWQNLDLSSYVQFTKAFPDLSRSLPQRDQSEAERVVQLDLRSSDVSVIRPSSQELALQLAENPDMTFNLLIRIGREIEDKLKKDGIAVRNAGKVTTESYEGHQGYIGIGGIIDLERVTSDGKTEMEVISQEVVVQLKTLLEASESNKVRIILGSFPVPLALEMATQIMKNFSLGECQRLIVCNYNMQQARFEELPLSLSLEK